VIDPPLESYVAVQLQTQFAEGVMEVPDVGGEGQAVVFSSSKYLCLCLVSPFYDMA